MGIYEKNSLIDKISDGSDLSDACLIAIKRCNRKIQEWIDNLPEKVHCLLCGILQDKKDLLFYAEDTPEFQHNEMTGSVKANRYVFGLCTKCAKELKQVSNLEGWDSKEILLWQIDFLLEREIDFSTFLSRGEAKRKIIERTSD